MFGNMSPVFPFDATPGSGNGTNDNDPFGLNSLTNTSNDQASRNDSFSGWTNDYTTTNNGMSGFSTMQNSGFGSTPSIGLPSNQTSMQQQQQQNGQGTNGFDINAAWTAWTDGGTGSFANSASNSAFGQNQNTSSANDNVQAQHQASSTTGVSPLTNLNVPTLHNARSSSAPVGGGSTPYTQQSALHSGQQHLGQQNQQQYQQHQHNVTQSGQRNNSIGQQGISIDAAQPISSGAFGMAQSGMHVGNNGFRSSRATPSEVYRTVVKP